MREDQNIEFKQSWRDEYFISGHLPQDWGVKQLLEKHSSDPFNPAVANVFFRTGMIEAWGRGIEHIIDVCHDANIPVPELRYEHSGLWVIFNFSNVTNKSGAITEKGSVKSSVEVSEKASVQTSEQVSVQTSEQIIELMNENTKITIRELAHKIGVTERSIERNIKKLQEKGVLRRVGADKSGYWEVLK